MTSEQHWADWAVQNRAENLKSHAKYLLKTATPLSAKHKALSFFLGLSKQSKAIERAYVKAHLPKLDAHEGYMIRSSNQYIPYKPISERR